MYAAVPLAGAVALAGIFAWLRSSGGSPEPPVQYSAQQLCGPDYKLMERHRIAQGTASAPLSLAFDSATVSYCAVIIRDKESPKASFAASLQATGHPPLHEADKNADYAGPVFQYAKQSCVTWAGRVNGKLWTSTAKHCPDRDGS